MAKLIKKYTNFMIGGENNLEKYLQGNGKIVVIFGHPLCVPCKKNNATNTIYLLIL